MAITLEMIEKRLNVSGMTTTMIVKTPKVTIVPRLNDPESIPWYP
jgi:hypothetical protein